MDDNTQDLHIHWSYYPSFCKYSDTHAYAYPLGCIASQYEVAKCVLYDARFAGIPGPDNTDLFYCAYCNMSLKL